MQQIICGLLVVCLKYSLCRSCLYIIVLSAQFGSFIDPFIILFAVPLCMVGALFALWVSGGPLVCIPKLVLSLVGLISKHGILITKFINDLREQGVPFSQRFSRKAPFVCVRF